MDFTLRDLQGQWRASNKRDSPASEGEILDPERELGSLAKKTRLRILGMFSITVNEVAVPIQELLPVQQFEGLRIVGVVSTLLGQEGLHAQGLWYSPDAEFDWFWAEITNVLAIEVREDNRFRGGAKCIWLTTAVAEYALTIPHKTYTDQWESTLGFFKAPALQSWPRTGYRPDWWPAESAGLWPGKQRPGELPRIVPRAEEVHRLTEQLWIDPSSSVNSWRRLGHYGDNRFPGQPRHNLYQLEAWELPFDGGIKVTGDEPGDNAARLQEEDQEGLSAGQGGKRKKANHGGRGSRRRRN
ncbi:hypothetical protein FRC11_014254 [Ceratobasidium sp. 423]|nr:hypothetical protein FRC11_014254 [Ceratobasidium sp. 423]